MDFKMISADGEDVSDSKRYFPFFDGENALVYSGLEGNFYVSSNNKFIVNIDGKIKKIKKAIKEGKLEGMIWKNLHSECYIVPRMYKVDERAEVVGLIECTSTNCYDILNKRHDINYILKRVKK
jgi:hypothetical protein